MYNFNHLYYFYITAKCGGVMNAAKYLRISQPALSSQLKTLEDSMDLKLFEKVGRTNKLTRAGLIVFGFCRQMFELSEEMSAAISKKIPTMNRKIYIGVSDEVERSFVVEVVSLFLRKFTMALRPNIIIVQGTQKQLVERLKFRELDVIITELFVNDSDLSQLACAETPVVLVGPKNLCNSKLNSVFKNQSTHWLMPSAKFKLRLEIDQFFEKNKLIGRILIESDVLASIVRSVVDGLGITFSPLLYITKEVNDHSVSILGNKSGYWKYRIWLVSNPRNSKDPLIQSFTDSFKLIAHPQTKVANHSSTPRSQI